MYASDFNVFCLCETWLSDHIFDSEVLPHDFILYRKDRPSRGGGVLIAVHVSIPSSLLSSPVYIPPNSCESYLLSLLNYLSDLLYSHSKCIIVGDFNFPDICWSTLSGTSSLSNYFCEFIFDYNLTQHVMEPTHIMGNILDLVVTSPSVNIVDLSIIPSVQYFSSDHFIVSFRLCNKIPILCSKPRYVFDFPKADLDSLCSYFSVCFLSEDIEFIWCTIKTFIYDAMLLYIPKVRLRSRQGPKWSDSNIRHQLKCLRTMRRKYKTHPTPIKLCKIKSLEVELQSSISSAKAIFESNLLASLQSNDSYKIFSYIRSITGQNNIPISMHFNGTKVISDQLCLTGISILFLHIAHSLSLPFVIFLNLILS